MFTFVFDNRSYTMIETFELGFGGSLVIDKLYFNRLHRRHGKNGFSYTGAQAA